MHKSINRSIWQTVSSAEGMNDRRLRCVDFVCKVGNKIMNMVINMIPLINKQSDLDLEKLKKFIKTKF